jgi:hypothetical protein
MINLAGVEGISLCRKFKSLNWQLGLSAHIDAKGLSGELATPPPDRPPDPKIGSPGAVRTVIGALKYPNVAPVQFAALAVSDGQERLGTVVKRVGRDYANTAGRTLIGVFRSCIETAPAIPARRA